MQNSKLTQNVILSPSIFLRAKDLEILPPLSGVRMTTQKGFTLIELLVAISIIGILASFLLANFIGVRQRARDGVRKSDLRQIQSALELYRSDQSNYPSSLPGCGSSLTAGGTTYMQKIPCDPSNGTPYAYSAPGNTAYSLIACLENGNDTQLDIPKANCSGSATLWQYTLQNP